MISNMVEIIYKNITTNNITIEHKATINGEDIDNIIHGAISIIESEWSEEATEQAIKRYFNL